MTDNSLATVRKACEDSIKGLGLNARQNAAIARLAQAMLDESSPINQGGSYCDLIVPAKAVQRIVDACAREIRGESRAEPELTLAERGMAAIAGWTAEDVERFNSLTPEDIRKLRARSRRK